MDFFKKASANLQEGGSKSDLFKNAQGFLAEQDKGKTPAPAETHPAPAADPPAPAAAHPAPATDPPATAAAPVSEHEASTKTAGAPAANKQGYGEVYGSAQTLYQGIQDKLSGKAEVDNRKLAGAANDVLKAAESSGLMGKDEQYKDYFTKAEGFLSNYTAKADEAKPVTASKPEGAPDT